jgi:predicted RNA binding protein YcfA (HicA-like mRNA interferase family)
MSKLKKFIARLLQQPKDFTYDELRKTLSALGYVESNKGKTSGSRVAFIHQVSGHIIRLHKPHPGNILKAYQLNDIVKELKQEGLL